MANNNLFGAGLAGSGIGPITKDQSNYAGKYGLTDRQAFGVNQDAINVDTASTQAAPLLDSNQSMSDTFQKSNNTSLYNKNQFGSGNDIMLDSRGSNYELLSSPEFAAYAGDKGIDINSLTSSELNTLGGDYIKTQNQGGMTGMEMGQIALGAGQLGLGLAGYLEDKKTAGVQRGLLKQQLADARKESETRAGVRSGLAAAFA